MLAEHGYARFATVCDTYVDSTFSSRTMIDSRLDTLSTDRNWSICEKFQIYRMYEVLEVMPRNPSGPMPGSPSSCLSFHSPRFDETVQNVGSCERMLGLEVGLAQVGAD